jgi:hypothetical protein
MPGLLSKVKQLSAENKDLYKYVRTEINNQDQRDQVILTRMFNQKLLTPAHMQLIERQFSETSSETESDGDSSEIQDQSRNGILSDANLGPPSSVTKGKRHRRSSAQQDQNSIATITKDDLVDMSPMGTPSNNNKSPYKNQIFKRKAMSQRHLDLKPVMAAPVMIGP